jgi:carbonyl reductase 1
MGRIALVTGANQGLGLAMVRGLAAAWTGDDIVYLTGRDPSRVEAAAGGLVRASARVVPELLDVILDDAVSSLAARLRARHGGVDIVISNAAARLTPDRPQADQVRAFIDTNNLGTTRMLRAFGPLMRPGGRFIVVASAFGALRNLPAHLHARFDTNVMTLDEVDGVMCAYAADVEEGRAEAEGWPAWINVASKVGQVAAMRVFARQTASAGGEGGGVFVAAACPGLVDTAASRPWFADMSQARTPEQAARALVALALEPDLAWRGELVQFGKVLPWT